MLAACPGAETAPLAKEPTVEPPAGDTDLDQAATCELELPVVALNMVVLTDATGAPSAYSSTIDCSTSNEWPCLHPAALNEYFQGDEPLCNNPADSATCVRFEYGAHLDYADLPAIHVDPECRELIALADDKQGHIEFATWKEAVEAATLACSDEKIFNPQMGNVYVVDNPWSTSSFNAFKVSETCFPVNYIDVERLPDGTAGPLEYVQAAAEHEMGHGYGLWHACSSPLPTSSTSTTNIMQTGDDCCCESWARLEAEDSGQDFDSAGASGDVCVVCSQDAGTAAMRPAACDGIPSIWNDTGCLGWVEIGDRGDPFTDATFGVWEEGAAGQIERILELAQDRCICDETRDALKVNMRRKVNGEISCHAGTATVGLFPLYSIDHDVDATAFMELAPIVITGDHLGRTAWITSINVVDFGEVSALHLPTQANGFLFEPNDPEDLLTTGLVNLTPGAPSATLSAGTAGTGYLWGAEGIPNSGDFDWPQVELTFVCSGAGGSSGISSQARPPGPYRLRTSDIVGSWNQQIFVRTDFERMKVWFEPRGYPRMAEVVPLTASTGGWYTWSLDAFGFEGTGTLKPTGSPVGSKLAFKVASASYDGWSESNLTLPDLDRLP